MAEVAVLSLASLLKWLNLKFTAKLLLEDTLNVLYYKYKLFLIHVMCIPFLEIFWREVWFCFHQYYICVLLILISVCVLY